MFNQRRQGEVSKMKTEDYNRAHDVHNADVLTGLSNFEQVLCEELKRIEVIGKCGRIVPVILTKPMQQSMEVLMEMRSKVGLDHNEFMFMCNTNSHIRGSDCIRKLLSEVEPKHPEYIRSTALRKHIAVMTQLINLKGNELDILAKYMGHDIRTHREYYRLPSSTVQVAKVSKLLLAMEGGQTLSSNPFDNDVLKESDCDPDDDEEEEDDSPLPTPEYEPDHLKLKECDVTSTTVPKKRNMEKRQKWTDEEKRACMKCFQKFILLKQVPGKQALAKQEKSLSQHPWLTIKHFLRNLYSKKQK